MDSVTSGYPRIYRMALWARVLVLVMGAAIGVLAAGLAFLLGDLAHSPGALAGVAALVLGVAAFGAWLIASTLRAKLVLTEDEVALYGTFGVRRLARADIAGRRLVSLQYGQKMLLLAAKDPRQRALKIASSIRTDAAWNDFLARLPDLDVEEARALEAEVAADAELGQTPEERLGRLAAARKTVKVLNVATYAVAAWGYIYPRPYELALAVLALLPWAAVALVARSPRLYRIDSRRGEARPTLAIPLIVPGMVLMLRAVLDVGVLDIEQALIYAALAAALLTWAAMKSDPSSRERPWGLAGILLLACGYGYGTVVLANVLLDSASGENFRVAVLDRHITRGKHTSYYLKLDRWGPRTEPADVSVTGDLYESSPPGSTVCVHRGPGALRISWYQVLDCGG